MGYVSKAVTTHMKDLPPGPSHTVKASSQYYDAWAVAFKNIFYYVVLSGCKDVTLATKEDKKSIPVSVTFQSS